MHLVTSFLLGLCHVERGVELQLAVVVPHAEARARPEDYRPHPPLEQEHGEYAAYG